jgi:hypothetical protein
MLKGGEKVMPQRIYVDGLDLPNLRSGALNEIRSGAAELSTTALRVPSPLQDDLGARTAIMESVYQALKSQQGFDPTVAGSASFKLRW